MNQVLRKNKLKTLIGFAYKSRKLVSGEQLTLDQIKRNSVRLVFLSKDASENTAKRIKDKSRTRNIPVCELFDRHELGQAIGKQERVVIGITDRNFANSMGSLLGGEACAKDASVHDSQRTGHDK